MADHAKDLGSASIRLLILCLSFIYFTRAFAQQSNFSYKYCEDERGNYTTNSTYKANLDRVLSVFLMGNNNGERFYSSSSTFYGQPDKIHVTGLCRGDVETEACHKCLDQLSRHLGRVCPYQKAAIGGFDECFLRYTNISSLGRISLRPRLDLFSTDTVSSSLTAVFLQNLRSLLDNLKTRALLGGDGVKFAAGNTSVPVFDTIHAMVQCTPDLSRPECRSCLEEAFGDIPEKKGWMGGRVVAPSCNFRYEVYRFDGNSSFDVSATMLQHSLSVVRSSQSSYTGATKGKKSNKSRNIIIITSTVVPSVAALSLILFIGIYRRVRKSSTNEKAVENILPPEASEEIGCAKCLQFNYSTIRDATNNFAAANKISENGLSEMFKGVLRDGQTIAVKKFNKNRSQFQEMVRNEVLIGSKVRHRNVVRFLGFCRKEDNICLVFEFVSSSLYRLLDPNIQNGHLDWERRYKIIKGITRGLLYLHEDCHSPIIHRDIKPSNILLDDMMNAKISGFDCAIVFSVDQTEESDNPVAGTFGYLAPEYAMQAIISVKTDVYSFGVSLLEIVSGKKSSNYMSEHGGSFTDYAWRNWSEGTPSNFVDPKMTDDITESEQEMIARCLQIGLLCVQPEPDTRPTMSSVLHMLSCVSLQLPMPSRFDVVEFDSISNSGNASPSDNIESLGKHVDVVATNSTSESETEV